MRSPTLPSELYLTEQGPHSCFDTVSVTTVCHYQTTTMNFYDRVTSTWTDKIVHCVCQWGKALNLGQVEDEHVKELLKQIWK